MYIQKLIGDIMKDQLLEAYLNLLQTDEEDFLNEVVGIATIAGISTTAIAISHIIKLITSLGKDYMTKIGRECNNFQGPAKNLCVLKLKIELAEKQLNIIKRESRNCSKTKNPNECRSKLKVKIDELIKKVNRLKEQQDIYLQKQRMEVESEKSRTQV